MFNLYNKIISLILQGDLTKAPALGALGLFLREEGAVQKNPEQASQLLNSVMTEFGGQYEGLAQQEKDEVLALAGKAFLELSPILIAGAKERSDAKKLKRHLENLQMQIRRTLILLDQNPTDLQSFLDNGRGDLLLAQAFLKDME